MTPFLHARIVARSRDGEGEWRTVAVLVAPLPGPSAVVARIPTRKVLRSGADYNRAVADAVTDIENAANQVLSPWSGLGHRDLATWLRARAARREDFVRVDDVAPGAAADLRAAAEDILFRVTGFRVERRRVGLVEQVLAHVCRDPRWAQPWRRERVDVGGVEVPFDRAQRLAADHLLVLEGLATDRGSGLDLVHRAASRRIDLDLARHVRRVEAVIVIGEPREPSFEGPLAVARRELEREEHSLVPPDPDAVFHAIRARGALAA